MYLVIHTISSSSYYFIEWYLSHAQLKFEGNLANHAVTKNHSTANMVRTVVIYVSLGITQCICPNQRISYQDYINLHKHKTVAKNDKLLDVVQ